MMNTDRKIRQWWLLLISGILFLLLGIWVLATPVASYLALSMLFIAGFLVSGIVEIGYAISNRHTLENWGWSLASGIVNVIIAFLLISTPGLSMVIMPIYIGFLLLFRSIMGISFSTHLKRLGAHNWGWALFAAILGIIFSFFMIWNPVFGGLTIIIYTAMALMTIGIVHVVMSIELKRIKNIMKSRPGIV